MAILEHQTIESTSGFKKELEESALTMIFDNLQKSQYHYPIKSTIREIACNALDSVKERDAVKEILLGKKKEEDYFIRRDDPIYKDSNFDPSYYDLNWLSDKKEVEIVYHSVPATEGHDYISIKDWGVGLGGKRLEGYMRLGYSTKRNSKLNIGKYGIGAKAPLSTNVESYRMISCYNGKRFIFDIYSHKVDSAIPRLNTTTDTLNEGYTFSNGYTAYYEKTTEKNSIEIIIKTKKHHKQPYIDAVKSQLLYLEGIKFRVNEDGLERDYEIHPDILYEDDKIVMANNQQYSRPHIVIDGVSYGYIDFLELELENMYGNVGIKVAPEEVSVTPSRETVVWNEQTRATIVKRFKEVVTIAAEYVENELDEKHFIKWLTKCTNTLTTTNSNTVLGRLSKLVDKSQINPSFPGNPKIKYAAVDKFFRGFRVRTVNKEWDKKAKAEKIRRSTETIKSWGDLDMDNIYLQVDTTSHRKDLYLYHVLNSPSNDRYSYLRKPVIIIEPLDLPQDTTLNDKEQKEYYDYQELILNELKKADINKYEEVKIPEDWSDKLDKIEEAEETGDAYDGPKMTPAERRKLNNSTVYKEPRFENNWHGSNIVFTIKEWTLKEVGSIDADPEIGELIYGTAEDRYLLEYLYRYTTSIGEFRNVKIISISQGNIKHYSSLTKAVYVKDYFKHVDAKEKSVGVGKSLVHLNTARYLKDKYKDLTFLSNFNNIDSEKADLYKKLYSYNNGNEVYIPSTTMKAEIETYLAKLGEFQLFLEDAGDNETLIKAKSKEIFGVEDIRKVQALDMEMVKAVDELTEYAAPIKTLLNEMQCLTRPGSQIPEEVETEIKNYISYKFDND